MGEIYPANHQLEIMKKKYPEKFASEDKIFSHIHAGDRIFIGTGCGEPQYLVRALINYVESNPKAFFDAEILHVWTLGVAPYTNQKFKNNFRHNSFFIGKNTREAVNTGMADYTPIFASDVPELFRRRLVPVDVAFIQTSLPDNHGYLSLGISVDIVKAAVENASLVIAQVNPQMPRIHGDTFINIKDLNFLIPYEEPLLEYEVSANNEISQKIGKYVSQIVEDGDTIQVGYGSLPNAILGNLANKKNLGIHTELLNDGIVDLMKKGVVDNSRKTIDRGKTVASFCMGKKETYEYLHDNPSIEFRTIDYTNNPIIIAMNKNMVAINSALEIDLTGQATAESLGKTFYSGIGGQADFMRGAVLAQGGKTVLALPSTTEGHEVSRIVPFLKEGAGVSLTRGDIHYVITEYGIAYLHGKNIRERAMSLISIAHPKFQPWLIGEAKKLALIFKDQAFIPGKRGEYPRELETRRTTKMGLSFLLRPVKISDEPLLKDFFYSLSERSMYKRFISRRKDMPHEMLQNFFVVIDYTQVMVIVAVTEHEGKEVIIGVGQYGINEGTLTAEVALVIKDDFQSKGIGAELLSYLAYIAKKQGLVGFTAEALPDNKEVLHLLEKIGFEVEKRFNAGVYLMDIALREKL
ncbi:MAG: GNAT family N-acetyltransferase [Bacillota bacterium]|nr:GNAT family N-acetyltransferase [Bacillota bacterium]